MSHASRMRHANGAHHTANSSTITLSRVSYAYPGAISDVLHEVSATFPMGWSGIIGDNGCGKSTLARIACGMLRPQSGAVTSVSTAVYCEQDASKEPTELADFACDYSQEAIRLRTTLGIADDMPWRYSSLSGGEQKKLQVAVALWQQPDLLVLDEPTNHVDANTRREIIAAAHAYRGIGIVISHDRELLDTLVDRCICFEGDARTRRVVIRPGGWSDTTAQVATERTEATRTRERERGELARLKAEQQRRAAVSAQTAARRSKRNLDPHDHDGKGRIGLAIVTGKDKIAGQLATRINARVEQAHERLDAAYVEKRYDGSLWLDTQPSTRRVIAHIEKTQIPLGEDRLLSLPELYIGPRDHIGIEGPNGAGKSTFIAHLLGRIDSGIDALVLPQEPREEERQAFLTRLREMDNNRRGELLSRVAQLNSDPKRLANALAAGADTATTSPGELRKLMLIEGALRGCPLIIMDEPTNHLDLHSTEALERALASYPGALVLVSHDARFLAACTQRTWHVENGELREL